MTIQEVVAAMQQLSAEDLKTLRSVLAPQPETPAFVGPMPEKKVAKVDIESILAAAPQKRLAGSARPGVFYTRVADRMMQGGNVPRQQQIIETLLVEAMPKGERITEGAMMDLLSELDGTPSFPIVPGKQDAWRVFKYYLHVQKDNKYFGFIQRRLLTVEGVSFRS